MKRGYAAMFVERLKFLSPYPRWRDFRYAPSSYGDRNFSHSPSGCGTALSFKKDFNFYLNSSRAASSGEFKFKIPVFAFGYAVVTKVE